MPSSLEDRIRIGKRSEEIEKGFIDGGTWVAQWVKRPTLDLGSGHDLMVHGILTSGSALAAQSLLGILSLSLSLSAPPLARSLSK